MDEGFSLGAAVTGLTFIGLGLLFLLEAIDLFTLRLDILLPAVVIAIGIAVLIGAMVRRGREG